jgi:hypothetical protein
MNTTWENRANLPDGHRLFDAIGDLHANGRRLIAIADNSGAFPQDTDDGVLWLDFAKPLWLGKNLSTIPVQDADSNPRGVVTNPATIMCLSEKYDWPINVLGILFKAVKA